MEESGQMHKMWTKWEPKRRKDCFSVAEASGIGFKSLQSAFTILVTALIMSVMIVILENIVSYSLKSKLA